MRLPNPQPQADRGVSALDRFLFEVLGPIGRMERRKWAGEYVRGLLSDTTRKNIASMAAHLPHGNLQAMHHVLAQSPWDSDEVMRRAVETAMADLEPEPAWVLRAVTFAKRGANSVGVAHQPAGPDGRIRNAQIGVSLHHVGARGNLILGWRLFLPHEWAADFERRRKAEIPSGEIFRTRPELALDLLDGALGWRIPRAVVVARVSVADCAPLVAGLSLRNLSYVLELPAEAVSGLAIHRTWTRVCWSSETPPVWRESEFSAARILSPAGFGCGSREVWLLAERADPAAAPTSFFLADLPENCSVPRLARLAKAGPRADAHVRELHARLGLNHFEGRGWRAWHHHVALVAVAHAFRMSERLRSQPDWFLEPAEPE
jgi:SRSO17 transposase